MKIVLAISLALISGLACAGTKGFDVLMLNIGEQTFYEKNAFKQYANQWIERVQDDCWETMHLADGVSGIKSITVKKLPPGMNIELATKVWESDAPSTKAARKIMHTDDGLTNSGEGYHGMYIIKPEGDQLTIMGVGANEDPKRGLSGISPKVTITLDPSKPEKGAKIFEQALCKVSKPFNIGFKV